MCPVLIEIKENTEKRAVVFDTETTGLDFRTDVIMLALSELLGNTISVKDSLELFMIQTVFKRNGIYSWYSKVR
jgi:DNA polymerase-3 subunit epsilon